MFGIIPIIKKRTKVEKTTTITTTNLDHVLTIL